MDPTQLFLYLFFVLYISLLCVDGAVTVCRRPCACKLGIFSCVRARSLSMMPDVSRVDFRFVKLTFSSVRSVPCDRLSPNLEKLDIRETPVPLANFCALINDCARVRTVVSSFAPTACDAPEPTAPTEAQKDEQTTCSNAASLGVAICFGILGLAASAATFMYYRRRTHELRSQFKQEIHVMFGRQEAEFERQEPAAAQLNEVGQQQPSSPHEAIEMETVAAADDNDSTVFQDAEWGPVTPVKKVALSPAVSRWRSVLPWWQSN